MRKRKSSKREKTSIKKIKRGKNKEKRKEKTKYKKTMWPSGLRRVTRNHFSSGGVGSNPAIVVVFSGKKKGGSD